MKNYIKIFIICAFTAVLIAGAYGIFFFNNTNKSVDGSGEILDSVDTSDDNVIVNDREERSFGGGSGGGGGGAGGGGSSGGGAGGISGEVVGENCFEQQIAYSLKDFKQNSDCNDFDGEICIKKMINCTIDVYNLDDNLNGMFEMRFDFLEEGIAFDFMLQSFDVAPNAYKTFEGVLEVESSGETGRANKELSCSSITSKVPKEEIC